MAGKPSRCAPNDLGDAISRETPIAKRESWYNNIQEWSAGGGLNAAIDLGAAKRLPKKHPSKWGPASAPKLKISDKA